MANPWDFVETKPAPNDQSPTWADYGKIAGSSLQGLDAQASAAARYIHEKIGAEDLAKLDQTQEQISNIGKEQTLGGISDEAHKRLESSITSGDFWSHPWSAGALKTTGMSAQLLASALPGGVVGGAVRATLVAGAAGGAVNAAQFVDSIYSKTDALSDKDLQSQSELYAGLRTMFDEGPARQQYNATIMGAKPALNFAAGAITNAIGPAGMLARGGVGTVLGAGEKGMAKRIGLGAAEGGGGGAAQGGVENYTEQTAGIEGGLVKDFDREALVNAILEPAVIGGAIGAGAGVLPHGKPAKPKDQVTPKVTEEAPTDTHAQQSTGRTGYASPPDVNAAPPNPQNAPTGSERVYDKTPTPAVGPKGEAIKAKSKKTKTPAVDTPIEIPPDQAAALKERAPPVEAVSDRQVANDLAEQHVPASPPEPVQAPVPPQIPPDVAAASQRVAERAPPGEPAQVPAPEPTTPVAPPPEVAAASKAVAQRAQERAETPPAEAQPKAPRVLQDKSAEAKAVREQQSEFDKNKFREEKTEQKAGERLSHDTAAEKEKIEADRAHAKELFTKHAPTPAEADFMSEDRTKAKASRTAILDRVSAIINEAAERGIDLKQRIHTSQSDEMAWLTEANSLLGKTKTKLGPIQKHYVQFKTRDNDYRSGAAEAARSERKSEGEAARRVDQGDVEEVRPAAHVELPTHESPEDILARKEEHSELRSEKEVYEEGRERKVVRPAEFSAGKNQAGKFKVETVKRPNITSKVKAVQEKVQSKAEGKVNTNPSEAQKEAGNYAKGHLKVDGLDITIETPRHAMRRGNGSPDANGVSHPWSVRMPDHYGYIKRTKGADGDHVDITYSGKGEHVFVIDQIDPSTGKFDEHKVMYGYKDGPAAMEAYEKSFSDGRGFDRIGNITPMSKEAFKTWLKEGNTKKEAAPQHELPIPTDAVALKGERQPIVPTPLANSHYRPLHITTAREVIPSLKFPKGEIAQAIGVVVSKRLEHLVGDTAIHVVSEHDMAKFTEANGGNPAQAYAGLYSPKTGVVYINENVNGNPQLRTHVVLHELLHTAVYHVINTDDKAAYTIGHLMQDLRGHLNSGRATEWEIKATQYGLTNGHEFMSEALSNPEFQKVLAKIDMSDDLVAHLIEAGYMSRNSRWSTMWDGLVASIRKWLGMPEGAHTLLEGALAQGDWLMSHRGSAEINKPADWKPGSRPLELPPRVREAARDRATDIGGSIRRTSDKWLSSFRQLSYRAAAGGEQFHANARSLVDAVSRMHQEATKILGEKGGEKVVRDIAEFERAHGTEALNQVAKVGFEASNVNVNLGRSADNTHLGKDVANNVQAKERLPQLQKDFDALHSEGQALLQSIGKYFRDIQNELSLQHITNILDHAGVNEPGLAQRIHQDGLTDADRNKFATDSPVRALNRVREFKRLQGLYLPFRRYGEFVVNGRHEVATPKGTVWLADGRVVWTDPNGGDRPARTAALAWAAKHDLTHTDTNKIFVDKQDHSKILPADDPNSVPAYAIRLQDQHTEFHTSESAAQRRAAELSEDGLKDVSVELRRELAAKNPGMMGGDMKMLLNALEKQTRFQNAPANVKNAMRQALTEAAVSAQGSTKIQSRFLQRRNVSGYSQDLGKVTAEYAKTSARYLAKLRYQPKVDEAFAAMDKTISDLKHQNNGQALRRSELRQALDQAIHSEPAQEKPGAFATATNRLLQISRLDKLAGVSFHVINAQEPWTTSLPVIGGRHGFASTVRSMAGIYNLLGARGAIMSSIRDTAKAFSNDFGFTDYIQNFKDNIAKSPSMGGDKAKRYSEMLDYIRDRGLLSHSTIFEVGRHADPSSNALGRGLDRADLMANQVGTAIETINRAVTALSAYELEYRRTGNHEGSMHYALEVTDKTMGDYSAWNSAKAFKTPAGALALQFKKFAQKTYYLLGSTFRGAIAGDREAMKQFAGLITTHAIVAGAMGLPLEPFKVALMAANVLGLTGFTWQDFEQVIREKAAAALGKKGGEVFSHGLPRAIGVESGARQGLDSLLTFGAPRSNKPNDLKAWLWDTAAGAPAGFIMDQVKMSQALMKGDFAQAAELAVPIKAASDAIKAARGVTPTTNDRGQETQRAMTPYEMGVRAIGFTPAAIAEQGERRAQAGRMSAQQRQERQDFENNWAKAKPYDRMLLWGRIEQWNKGRPRESQLTRSQLDSFVRSQGKSNAADVGGIRNSKQNRDVLERVSVYNN